ncbi:MAG: hypothetical protein PWR29_1423 [Methanolobus sp.]|jgi:hypothetical protein|nr:hypothetical protein [Methanolobus sp.]MDK2912466.1 hypothetical protein [Methanolobus sp.]MDN5310499.1 hypothetical protein [Methanolobus sp.]
MSVRTFKDCETAVSTVVSAVLFLGIIVALLTVIHVSYVPEWKTSAEQAHMDDVYYDMSVLRSNIDILSVASASNPGNTMIFSVPIRAGGASIPLVSPGRSSGTLAFAPGTSGMRITANDTAVSYNSGNFLEELGTVYYTSDNSYFVDQTYAYESGALILAQGELSLMKQSPSIAIRRTDNSSNITLYLNAIQIPGTAKAISSNSIEEVRVRYTSSATLYAEEVLFTDLTLRVDTAHPAAWEEFLRREVTSAGLGTNEYSISSNSTSVILGLEGAPGKHIKADVRKSVFEVSFNHF